MLSIILKNIYFITFPLFIYGNKIDNFDFNDKEILRSNILADIVISNFKENEWRNIIIFGHFPNEFYLKLKNAAEKENSFTFVTSNTDKDDHYVEGAVGHHSNTILMDCTDFINFEESLRKVMNMPSWHPHANIYIYYHLTETKTKMAKIFYILRYYRAPNVLLIQYDDVKESFLISNYTPYVSENYDFEDKFGCWLKKRIGMPIYTFEESFVCENNCHNVSITSKLRTNSLGTCIGFITHVISYNDTAVINGLNLFEVRGKNFHGFAFRAYATEVLPFMKIIENPDKTYRFAGRDGNIWDTLKELMNFTIDLSSSVDVMKKPFDFEININHIFAVAYRKGDLFLSPIYQFDVVVVELDYTFAYKESGVCFMSRRAEYETVLFDLNTALNNYESLIKFTVSFFCILILFCIYSRKESLEKVTFEFLGRNYLNSVRSVLLITLHRPPKMTSFRVFMTFIIWSFFIINFATQAAIISFFSAIKRGQEVDTFDDIIEKGYPIEGMSSPDVVLPDVEERFRKINSKLSPILDIFACVNALRNDSHRFCLVDCAQGRYMERNALNEKGEQYLHIAKEDRVHSHYLNFVFPKHSVMTDYLNKYLMILFEAGLIKKWEDSKYSDIKEEVPVKSLSMTDIKGIFNLYCLLIASVLMVFFLELYVGCYKQINAYIVNKVGRWKRTRELRNIENE